MTLTGHSGRDHQALSPHVSCWRLVEQERLCPEPRVVGEGPTARMIGKDFLAKLLSRWIYPGLVLVDSGTFSLLSRFLFMTCHLLQQARREPLASGCRSGAQRHRCRELLTPFQERCQSLAGHPCPTLLPEHVSPARPGWSGGKGQLLRGREELAAAPGSGGCCASDAALRRYSDHLQPVHSQGLLRGHEQWPSPSAAPSPLLPSGQDGQHQEGTGGSCPRQSCEPWHCQGKGDGAGWGRAPAAPKLGLQMWILSSQGSRCGFSRCLVAHQLCYSHRG